MAGISVDDSTQSVFDAPGPSAGEIPVVAAAAELTVLKPNGREVITIRRPNRCKVFKAM